MVKYRWVRMGTEKKRFLYQPSGSADKKTFDYASSAGCIAPDSWAAPAPGESLQSDRSDPEKRSEGARDFSLWACPQVMEIVYHTRGGRRSGEKFFRRNCLFCRQQKCFLQNKQAIPVLRLQHRDGAARRACVWRGGASLTYGQAHRL